MLAMSKAVVAGASFSPNKRESFLLKAAREKCRLAPHSWQRVALMPTSAPQTGHSFGRGCCSPPKSPPSAFFHRSNRHCQP